MIILSTLEYINLDNLEHQIRFKMVHSSPKNTKSKVRQSQVCYLHTTNFGPLKGTVPLESFNKGFWCKGLTMFGSRNRDKQYRYKDWNFDTYISSWFLSYVVIWSNIVLCLIPMTSSTQKATAPFYPNQHITNKCRITLVSQKVIYVHYFDFIAFLFDSNGSI